MVMGTMIFERYGPNPYLTMPNTPHSPYFTYFAALVGIFGWWVVAFSTLQSTPSPCTLPPQEQALSPSFTCPLLPLDRAKWHQALTGDLHAIQELLANWEIESRLLESYGLISNSSFKSDQFLQAHELVYRLLAREQGRCHPLPSYHWEHDDRGTFLQLTSPPSKFLPQTEHAAVILLTLCQPEQITSLPSRLRHLPLFPQKVLNTVPCNLDPNCSEMLFCSKPDVAFIAHYTAASTVQALRDQKIPAFLTTRLDSVDEVLESLLKIGHVVDQSEKAELLVFFVKAGLATLDQRIQAARTLFQIEEKNSYLYLQRVAPFCAPTERSLAGQLVERLRINQRLDHANKTAWSLPLSAEMLQYLAPSKIICSLSSPEKNLPSLYHHPLLTNSPAAYHGQIFGVEEAFQDSPTHFLLLGYFDLVSCLLPQALK